MPTIFIYFGFTFFFSSNDHKPVHVHVDYAGHQNKLEFVYENGKLKDVLVKRVKGVSGLQEAALREAIKFVKAKEPEISIKWIEFYVKGKRLTPVKITKKI